MKEQQGSTRERIAYAQLAFNHPVLKENKTVRRQYYSSLKDCCSKMFELSKYGSDILIMYRSCFKITRRPYVPADLGEKLNVVLLLDIAHISCYMPGIITTEVIKEFEFDEELFSILDKLFSKLSYNNPQWNELKKHSLLRSEKEWIERVRANVAFSQSDPYKIMVTSTMSAGKSTFINALVGKKVASTKNLACTGRVHYIYSKPAYDGLTGKWVGRAILNAQNSILSEDEELQSAVSYESLYYNGKLRGEHCVILDTPGVNSAEYEKHGMRTDDVVKRGSYDLIIFLINYEQFGTDDERLHLSFIRKNAGDGVPVIFCVNKIDSMKQGDTPLDEIYREIELYLKSNGFENAPLFFVSSKSAYFYRVKDELTSEDDIDDLDYVVKKVKRSTNIVSLYDKVCSQCNEADRNSFDYQCGIGYIEDYILKHFNSIKERT